MNKTTKLIIIIALGVVSTTIFYSAKNILYYSRTGQLATVSGGGNGGYGYGQPLIENYTISEKMYLNLTKFNLSSVFYTIDKPVGGCDSKQATAVFNNKLPNSTADQAANQKDVIINVSSNMITSSATKCTRRYEILRCSKIKDFSKEQSFDAPYGVILPGRLQVKNWINEWNLLVKEELLKRGVSPSRQKHLLAYYSGINTSEQLAFYPHRDIFAGKIEEDAINLLIDKDVYALTEDSACMKGYELNMLLSTWEGGDVSKEMQDIDNKYTPLYSVNLQINTNKPKDTQRIDKVVNAVLSFVIQEFGGWNFPLFSNNLISLSPRGYAVTEGYGGPIKFYTVKINNDGYKDFYLEKASKSIADFENKNYSRFVEKSNIRYSIR